MLQYAFIKNGRYVIVKKDEYEFLENFIDRGQYIAKIDPKNEKEYIGTVIDSKLFIYNKLYNKEE